MRVRLQIYMFFYENKNLCGFFFAFSQWLSFYASGGFPVLSGGAAACTYPYLCPCLPVPAPVLTCTCA